MATSKTPAAQPLRIGIIGFGRMGRKHYDSVQQVAEALVTTIAEPQSTGLPAGLPPVVEDPDMLIGSSHVDAVIICSPTHLHYKHIAACVAAGKPFLCEKPIAPSVAEADSIRQLVEASGVYNQIGFNRRFDTGYMRLRQAVVDGNLGELRTAQIIARDPAPPPMSYVKVSGGLYQDMAIHDFDMLRFLTGWEFTKVHATGSCIVDKAIGDFGDIDTAVTVLSTADGRLGTIHNCRAASYGHDQRAEILGSKAMIQMNNQVGRIMLLKRAQRPNDCVTFATDSTQLDNIPLTGIDRYSEAYRQEVRVFVHNVLNRVPAAESPCTVRDAQIATILAATALKSLKSGAAAEVEQISS